MNNAKYSCRKAQLIIMAVTTLLLTACVKDDLSHTPHPDSGAIVVRVDWDGLSAEAPEPANYVIDVDGVAQEATGPVNTVEELAEPGEHTLLIYNRPEGFTINGDIASVNEVVPANRADADNPVSIEPLPGYLYSYFTTLTVTADDTLRVRTSPEQHVRRLELELVVTEGDYSRIASVEGTLSGVERSVNLRTGERLGTVAATHTAFTLDGNRCEAAFRLVDVVPAVSQTLTVDIRFTDGETYRFVSDLSQPLSAFADDVEPLRLTANLHLSGSSEFTGTIVGWQPTAGENVEVQ